MLSLEPPLTLKAVASGYELLWPFLFWPIFAGILGVFGLALGWQTWRTKRTHVP
jgi:hypothetical protein